MTIGSAVLAELTSKGAVRSVPAPQAVRDEVEAYVRFTSRRVRKGQAIGRGFRWTVTPPGWQAALLDASHDGPAAVKKTAAGLSFTAVKREVLEEAVAARLRAEMARKQDRKQARKLAKKAKARRARDLRKAAALVDFAAAEAALRATQALAENLATLEADLDAVVAKVTAGTSGRTELAPAGLAKALALENRAAVELDSDVAAGLRERARELRKAPMRVRLVEETEEAYRPDVDEATSFLMAQRKQLGLCS